MSQGTSYKVCWLRNRSAAKREDCNVIELFCEQQDGETASNVRLSGLTVNRTTAKRQVMQRRYVVYIHT